MKIRLYRVYLDRDGYDRFGAYFGRGEPLYYYYTETDRYIGDYLRGRTRDDAKRQVKKLYPSARFYR